MAYKNSGQKGDLNNSVVRREVEELLHSTPSFRQLDAATQSALADSMTKVAGFLADGGGGFTGPLAGQMAPVDLRSRLARQDGAPGSQAGPGAQPGTQPATGQAGAGTGARPSAVGRVGDVTRATLNAIDFPEFVSSLIQGTFQAIVDASIQQMEAYAELVHNISQTVDQFMADNISDNLAQDYLSDRYDNLFTRDVSSGQPQLVVNRDGVAEDEMPSFFKDLGFDSPADIDDQAIEEVIIPATRSTLAEQRQQTLATMVLMGINRVVVDDGEIMAKLQFHIDASESMDLRFDQTKTTSGNIAGTGGRKQYMGAGIMVNTSSLNAQSDINVRTDLTGQVKVRFRSETFPLERFADSMAIQLINQRAYVPQATTESGSEGDAQSASGAPAPAQPAAGPAAQSLAEDDPWAPRSVK